MDRAPKLQLVTIDEYVLAELLRHLTYFAEAQRHLIDGTFPDDDVDEMEWDIAHAKELQRLVTALTGVAP